MHMFVLAHLGVVQHGSAGTVLANFLCSRCTPLAHVGGAAAGHGGAVVANARNCFLVQALPDCTGLCSAAIV